MVIVCPECSTKFRVNPERIPASGAKVRCARCKHVFLAEKPAPAEEPQPEIIEPETPGEEPVTETPAFSSEPRPPEPSAAPEPEEEVSFDSGDTGSDSFSYDQFRELDTTSSDEDFSFGSDEDEQLIADQSAPEPADDEETAFSFSGAKQEAAPQMAGEGNDSPLDELLAAAKEKPATDDVLSKEEKLAQIFADEEESAADAEAELPTATKVPAKSSPASSIIRVLLLLILGLAIIGGALYYINGPEAIEQAIQQIIGQQSRPAAVGKIALTNLEGKFIQNQEAGELFVIRGKATNNYGEPRAAIQVKGVIFDQNGNPLLQKTIFCGNPISDQELQTLSFSKLEEMMRNQFGKSLNNMKVNSKEAIPFVIAFRDLPKNLSEFSVDVTSSEPAAK